MVDTWGYSYAMYGPWQPYPCTGTVYAGGDPGVVPGDGVAGNCVAGLCSGGVNEGGSACGNACGSVCSNFRGGDGGGCGGGD